MHRQRHSYSSRHHPPPPPPSIPSTSISITRHLFPLPRVVSSRTRTRTSTTRSYLLLIVLLLGTLTVLSTRRGSVGAVFRSTPTPPLSQVLLDAEGAAEGRALAKAGGGGEGKGRLMIDKQKERGKDGMKMFVRKEVVEMGDRRGGEEEGEGEERASQQQAAEAVVRPPAPAVTRRLPKCERTMLFRFAGLHGFCSEFSLLLRAASLARVHSYVLILDTSSWNYGTWTDYFLPLSYTCRLPRSGIRRVGMHMEGEGEKMKWTKANHVVWNKRDLDGMDRVTLGLFSDKRDVEKLHREDRRRLELKATEEGGREGQGEGEREGVVPRAFEDVFRVQESVARELWRVNDGVEEMIEGMKKELRGKRRGKKGGGLVAAHVRLGDKYLEADRIGPQAYDPTLPIDSSSSSSSQSHNTPGLHTPLITSYLKTSLSLLPHTLSHSHSHKHQPTLLLMSDDPSAHSTFQQHSLGEKFNIVGTSALASLDTLPVAPLAKDGGFHETHFNDLPLSSRISQTKLFVRDLTYLARGKEVDGWVLTGSSNVGRVLMLLIGEERLGGVRSLDTRWFPTAQFS